MTAPVVIAGDCAPQQRAGTAPPVLYLCTRSTSRLFSGPVLRHGRDGALLCPVTEGETRKAIPPGRLYPR